jgi:hypothetical protein
LTAARAAQDAMARGHAQTSQLELSSIVDSPAIRTANYLSYSGER